MRSAEAVLDFVVHMLDAAGLLSVPLQQPSPIPIEICHHRVIVSVGPIGK
jgi:hypothetical protein